MFIKALAFLLLKQKRLLNAFFDCLQIVKLDSIFFDGEIRKSKNANSIQNSAEGSLSLDSTMRKSMVDLAQATAWANVLIKPRQKTTLMSSWG